TGTNFPDALSAGAAAAREGGPVLLVGQSSIHGSVYGELARLKPQRIVVVGGPLSIPDSVLDLLRAYSPSVTRVSGDDRYAVSRELLKTQYTAGAIPDLYIATGAGFPDALGAGYAAGYRKVPVLLVDG